MKNMKKMQKRTKAKFLGILTIILVLICGICGGSLIYVSNTLSNQLTYTISAYEYSDKFGDASGYLTDEVRAYAANGNKVHYDNYWYEVNTAQTRDICVAGMKDLGISAKEEALIEEVFSISNNLIPLEDQFRKGHRRMLEVVNLLPSN